MIAKNEKKTLQLRCKFGDFTDCDSVFDCDSGMFQRLDRMRKHSFGSMIVFGENNNNTVSGLWMWRGHELAFTVYLCLVSRGCRRVLLM